MEPLLEIRDLKKTFKIKNFFGSTTEVQALKGISLSIAKGESLGIVGESGCGKSTLANLIIRLDEPTEGSIILDGQDISHIKEKALRKLRSRIQIVFQDPYSSLSPRMTVEEILTEPMCVEGVKTTKQMRDKAVELLELVGMRSSNLSRYPHVQVRLLSPFPAEEIASYLRQAKKIIVIEHNATAQLANLLRMHIEQCPHLENILQYDGDIMYSEQLLKLCKEVL